MRVVHSDMADGVFPGELDHDEHHEEVEGGKIALDEVAVGEEGSETEQIDGEKYDTLDLVGKEGGIGRRRGRDFGLEVWLSFMVVGGFGKHGNLIF